MSFNSQKGVVTLATILLAFTIAGLLTAGAGVYTHVEERIELNKVVKMIRDNARTLKKHHGDDPKVWAQAEAWEEMAHFIESHKDIVYNQKMFKEAVTLGVNLIPGKLPFKKGTREVIEFGKNIYDTASALEEVWRNRPQEVSSEMKDFLKILSRGKIDADALEIAMLRTRERALIREWEKLLADKKADEEWQRQQEEHLKGYREKFIQNTLEELNETGRLSSLYKRLWKQSGLQEELAKYPQIAEALKKTEEEVPITREEKDEIDDITHEVVSQNEVLKEALIDSLTKKQGDWEKDIARMAARMGKIAIEGVIPEEKKKVPEEHPVEGMVVSGRIIPPSGFLESIRNSLKDCTIYWVKEHENYLELRFNRAGGKVTGSFRWRYGHKEEYPDVPPLIITFDELHIGDLTGTYSGGKTGSFQGKFTGTIANTVNGEIRGEYSGPFSGTWMAEMDAKGHISGHFEYLNPVGKDKRLSFEAI